MVCLQSTLYMILVKAYFPPCEDGKQRTDEIINNAARTTPYSSLILVWSILKRTLKGRVTDNFHTGPVAQWCKSVAHCCARSRWPITAHPAFGLDGFKNATTKNRPTRRVAVVCGSIARTVAMTVANQLSLPKRSTIFLMTFYEKLFIYVFLCRITVCSSHFLVEKLKITFYFSP